MERTDYEVEHSEEQPCRKRARHANENLELVDLTSSTPTKHVLEFSDQNLLKNVVDVNANLVVLEDLDKTVDYVTKDGNETVSYVIKNTGFSDEDLNKLSNEELGIRILQRDLSIAHLRLDSGLKSKQLFEVNEKVVLFKNLLEKVNEEKKEKCEAAFRLKETIEKKSKFIRELEKMNEQKEEEILRLKKTIEVKSNELVLVQNLDCVERELLRHEAHAAKLELNAERKTISNMQAKHQEEVRSQKMMKIEEREPIKMTELKSQLKNARAEGERWGRKQLKLAKEEIEILHNTVKIQRDEFELLKKDNARLMAANTGMQLRIQQSENGCRS